MAKKEKIVVGDKRQKKDTAYKWGGVYTPYFECLAAHTHITPAMVTVYGRVWRYSQLPEGVCSASQRKLAASTGYAVGTVSESLSRLVELRLLRDETPNRRNRPHRYRLTRCIALYQLWAETLRYARGLITDDDTKGANERNIALNWFRSEYDGSYVMHSESQEEYTGSSMRRVQKMTIHHPGKQPPHDKEKVPDWLAVAAQRIAGYNAGVWFEVDWTDKKITDAEIKALFEK